MDHMGLAIVGVALFSFLAISAVAGTIAEYKKRSLELEVLRAAAERGQPLDPTVVAQLTTRYRPDPESEHQPADFRIGGIITIGSGIGVALLACFLIPVAPQWVYPVVGVGAVTVCVGVSLLICARTIERRRDTPANRETDA